MERSHEEAHAQSSMLGSWVDVEALEDSDDNNFMDLHSVKSEADSEPDPAGQADEWLDVLGHGQLKKKVLKAGQGQDSRPQKGQNVVVDLKTSLKDGTLVKQQTNVAFTLGDGDIIRALDLIVQLMETGEKALVQTDAKYAYGLHGSHKVPPNAELCLEVDLVEVMDVLDLELLLPSEKAALAGLKRERGNVHYQRRDYELAVNSYTIALQITRSNVHADTSPAEEKELTDERVKCLNNMAASQLKMEDYDGALRSCLSVLAHQPENVKALYRIGQVFTFHGEHAGAVHSLKMALKLEPENKAINAELCRLVKMQREAERPVDEELLENPETSNCSTQTDVDTPPWAISWYWLFGATAAVVGGLAISVFMCARK